MKITAKVDYACHALVELGLHWPNREPLQIQTIAKRQGIPLNFLTHILIGLKQSGCVESSRGKSGGYYLTKPPAEITLKDIISNFGGSVGLFSYNHPGKRPMDIIWQDINKELSKQMEGLTLATICERVKSQSKNLTYDI